MRTHRKDTLGAKLYKIIVSIMTVCLIARWLDRVSMVRQLEAAS